MEMLYQLSYPSENRYSCPWYPFDEPPPAAPSASSRAIHSGKPKKNNWAKVGTSATLNGVSVPSRMK